MKISEIKAKLAATMTPQPKAMQPVDDKFITLTELLRRVQQTPDTTMQQAADCLLSWGLLMDGAPKIMVNSKARGVVEADATQAHYAIRRIEYVSYQGKFEGDIDGGCSSDYELFGFDRREFGSFLADIVGESLDLFCPLGEILAMQQAEDAPADQRQPVPASVANALDVVGWKARARKFALAYIARHKEQGLFPNQEDVCAGVEKEMRSNNVVGAHGRPPTASYIKRNAISGEWWKANRP